MTPRPHLVIFVKAPRLGAVKTRLAKAIGRGAAWRFYRAASRRLIHRLGRDRRWLCWLAVTPDRFARKGRFWPRHPPRLAQGAGDLGARMARPLRRLPPGPVVIVGSDIPDLDAGHVAAAFRALRRAEVVFGPASDGGYWLVGFRRRPALVVPFDNVTWSSARALAETRANIGTRFRVATLETLADVDDGAGWRCWRAKGAGR
ncbi:MAG: TIGR04282 family arsenosugar biosynthesis glycosyltransferase [Alphaproteobacteria bacterium]|jgi:hypothetical protein|nr:TIGR04282 family arsenosugar biosynthesis glycosyltransferase [Alphaproteobacteria bacterium]